MMKTSKKTVNLGEAVGISDVELPSAEELSGNAEITESISGAPQGDALWWYMNKGTINGVPVAEADRCAKVDSEALLDQAFILDRKPRSSIFRLSPDRPEELAAYDELLALVYGGKAIIVDETKQFDTANGCFLVWVRYDELCYMLHPRYGYLKD